jgi:hypothetical protein
MNHKLNAVLAVATILGGIAAIWFFWDKIRPLIFRQAKSGIKNVDNEPTSLDSLANVEKLMPDLLAEMRFDLAEHPLSREFILRQRGVDLQFSRRHADVLFRRSSSAREQNPHIGKPQPCKRH